MNILDLTKKLVTPYFPSLHSFKEGQKSHVIYRTRTLNFQYYQSHYFQHFVFVLGINFNVNKLYEEHIPPTHLSGDDAHFGIKILCLYLYIVTNVTNQSESRFSVRRILMRHYSTSK